VKVVSQQLRLVDRLEKTEVACYAAKGFYYRAIAEVKADATAYDSIQEYQTVNREMHNGMECTWQIVDESARININTITKDIMKNIEGFDEESADKVVSYTHKPFPAPEALIMSEGLSAENFKKAKNFITVFGDGKVNINTAPQEVLRALGLSDPLVEVIMEYRRGPDLEEGTEDDFVFESKASILADLQKYAVLSLDQEQELTSLLSKDILEVHTSVFRVVCHFLANERSVKNIDIVCEDQQDGMKLIYWGEY